MSTIDWIILGVITVSTLISTQRGFVKEALSLVTLVLALVVSRMFAGQVATLLAPTIEVPSLRLGAAYILLIFGTLIVGGLVNRLISEVVKLSGLGSMDRFLGMLFGLSRGALVVLIVVAGLYYLTPVQQDGWWQQSTLIPHFVAAVEWLGPILIQHGEQFIEGAAPGTLT